LISEQLKLLYNTIGPQWTQLVHSGHPVSIVDQRDVSTVDQHTCLATNRHYSTGVAQSLQFG